MLPVIAIVGRANVGKSTLFNQLTRTQDALVVDLPGVTRDRQYGQGQFGTRPFIVIDTGGMEHHSQAQGLDLQMADQTWQAVEEADQILFLVDIKAGLTALDETIFAQLRRLQKPLYCVVNKIDGVDLNVHLSDFYRLGLKTVYPIAALSKRGLRQCIEAVLSESPQPSSALLPESQSLGIKVAVIGRPNVGKSTLINRLLGEARLVVFDQPGTTRDSLAIPFEQAGQRYTLIDTAGIRRRTKVQETVEKFSVIKALQAVEHAHVVLFVLNATTEISAQDLSLLNFILQSGRALVISVNQWDALTPDQRAEFKLALDRRLNFIHRISYHFISALKGTRCRGLLPAVKRAYACAMKTLSTPELTRILEWAVKKHEPPLVRGRRIKLRFAHSGGHNPPVIVIHGNQTDLLPDHYKRFLMKTYLEALDLEGTPLKLEFKTGENPYRHQRNTLTPRQSRQRKQLLKQVKKQKKS